MREYLVHDESAEKVANEVHPSPSHDDFLNRYARSEMHRATGRALGQLGPGVVLVVAITAGLWLAWQFINQAPCILAESILDGPLSEARPTMGKSMHLEPWLQHPAYATAPHFLGLALAALVAGIFWPPFLANPF